MPSSNYLFTSESVSEGHPDKVCDRISDEIVDLFFREGPKHGFAPKDIRVACETLATTNRVIIAGETRGPKEVSPERIVEAARRAIRDIGYEQEGFHWKTANMEVLLHAQSAHIAQGVDASGNKDEGAGDQGIMFGYACRETPELMPAPLCYSHKILKLMADARKSGREPKLGPDAKSQVTLRYADGRPVEVTQIVVSTQHLDESMTSQDVRAVIEPYVLAALPAEWVTPATVWHVNAGSRAARSSSTPMAARHPMAAARSLARIPRKWIAPLPMPRATWRKTWWRQGSRIVARSRFRMRSASPIRSRSMSTCMARAMSTKRSCRRSCRNS